jgi:hypothetical protein
MKEFERMQKLVFGDTIPALKYIENKPTSLTENTLKAKIKELVHSSLGEAKKKKKGEDVAPQEDVNLEMDATEEMPEDTMAPEPMDGADIDPTVKSIQDSLQKAFAQAKTLGDEKLIAQIGNTITMLVRTQVLGGQQMAESINENVDWNDDQIYNSLMDMDQEQLISDMLSTVEENPSITLLEYCKQFEYED